MTEEQKEVEQTVMFADFKKIDDIQSKTISLLEQIERLRKLKDMADTMFEKEEKSIYLEIQHLDTERKGLQNG